MPGALRELKPEYLLLSHLGRTTTDHMANMQLGHFVVGHIRNLVTLGAEIFYQLMPVFITRHLGTDKNMCLLGSLKR